MIGVTQHQLQRVFPGWQFNYRLGFALAEMNVPLIAGDRLMGIEGVIHVDQQVVMTALWRAVTRPDNTHVA